MGLYWYCLAFNQVLFIRRGKSEFSSALVLIKGSNCGQYVYSTITYQLRPKNLIIVQVFCIYCTCQLSPFRLALWRKDLLRSNTRDPQMMSIQILNEFPVMLKIDLNKININKMKFSLFYMVLYELNLPQQGSATVPWGFCDNVPL